MGDIFNANLLLRSKDFYRFKELFISIQIFNDKKVYNEKIINKYIGHIKNERKMLLENNMNLVSEQIKNQIELLENNLPDCKEKGKIIMKILTSKYKEVTNIECREILCDFVLKNDKLLKISNMFLMTILNSFFFTPASLESEDDSYNPFSNSSESNRLLKKINEKATSKILKENLKFIFKFKIFEYYNKKLDETLDNEEEKTRQEIDVYLGEESFNYFRIAHDILIKINSDGDVKIPNKNIKEIFCIVYCCIFLENFVKYAFTQITLVSGNKNEIINYLNKRKRKSKVKETFKLFILKELKDKYITERTQFLNIDKWLEDYHLRDLFKDLKFEKSKNNQKIQESLTNLFSSDFYHNIIGKSTLETFEPNFIILDRDSIIPNIESEFPYYYEFLSISMVSENQLKEVLQSIDNFKSKYPVLYSYLDSNKKDIKYLQTFSQINNFVNYTIENYSNQISRKQAQCMMIREELDDKKIPMNLFTDFLKAFNSGLYKIADKYQNHYLKNDIYFRKLFKEYIFSDFLIDDGNLGYGMQIAAVYEKYISFQNNFLNKIIENTPSDNKKLNYIIEGISESINPQKANKFNVISFDIITENYESFLEMILFYSYKDSFDDQYNFDFSKKDKIKYDFEEIEEQLEHLLLPRKKIFNETLEFVIYQFEGFRGHNSSILSAFILEYPQKKLDEEQKQILYNYRSEKYSTKSIINILFSIQLMIIFYYNQTSYSDKNIRINETFNDFPFYFKISDDTKNLFSNYPFTISHILSIYEYFELLSFNEFKNNIDPGYKFEISDEEKENIEKYFKDNPNPLLNKLEISTAVRRLISRSLVGMRGDYEVELDCNLFTILRYKEDCWNREISSNERFDEELENLEKFNIPVKEALNLYEKLGGDSLLLGETVKKEVQEIKKKIKRKVKRPKY